MRRWHELGGSRRAAPILGALVAIALQAVGLVHPSTLVPWAVLVGLTLLVTLADRHGSNVSWSGTAWLMVGMASVCALQLVPLPISWVKALSPTAVDVRTFGLPARDVRLVPLSLDPVATVTELLKYLTYAGIAVAATHIVRHVEGRGLLARAVVLGGLVFTASSVLHTVGGSFSVWWLYRPEDPTPGLVRATLVNSNHVAGVFAALAPVTLALAFKTEGMRRRMLFAAAGLQLALGILTLSRGGGVACLLGVLLFAAGFIRRGVRDRDRDRGRVRSLVPVAVLVLACLSTVAYVAYDRFVAIVAHSRATGLSADLKVKAWRDALGMVDDYWITGVGRGAFVLAFPRYRALDLPSDVTFHYAESLPVQLLTELGVPLALAVLGAVFFGIGRGWRSSGDGRMRLGALAGLTALLAHNLVDFSLEVPAVAALAILLAALAGAGEKEKAARSGAAKAGRFGALALAAGIVVVAVVSRSSIVHHTYRRDAESLAKLLEGPEVAGKRARAEEIARRHPADYAVPLLIGEWAARARMAESLRWLNRAVFLNPRGGGVHVAIAGALRRAGLDQQALLELRLAQIAEPLRTRALAKQAVDWQPRFERLRAFIGTGRGSALRAVNVAEILHEKSRHPDRLRACESIANRREKNVRHYALTCVAEVSRTLGNSGRALEAARALAADHPMTANLVRVLRVISWAGDEDGAERLLARALEERPADPELVVAAAQAALARDDLETAVSLAEKLQGSAGTDAEALARGLHIEGLAHLKAHRPSRAIAVCERALSLVPESVDLLRCVGDASFEKGDRGRSRAAYEELRASGHADETVLGRLEGLKRGGI